MTPGADYKKAHKSIMGGANLNGVAANSTRYQSVFGEDDQAAALNVRIPVPFDMIVTNFYVDLAVAPGVGESIICRILGSIAGTVEVTIADANTTGSDLVNAATFTAGGYIYIRFITSLNCAVGQVKWAFEYRS